MLQTKEMCDIITTIHGYLQREKNILNLATLDRPYLELGKTLPMLAFWIVTTDPVFVVNRCKPAPTGS